MKAIATASIAFALGYVPHASAAYASTETVLYSFCGQQNCADGELPIGNLIKLGPKLYGTTSEGGGYCSVCGVVFSLDPKTGAEKVVHAFGSNSPDGANPMAGLTDVKGTFYGTTEQGGDYGAGTVFSLTPKTGNEAVLYSFCSQQNCTDGKSPALAGVIDAGGTLYGTTLQTGEEGGTVFSLDPATGAETVLHTFGSNNGSDGIFPAAGVIYFRGFLFGTTVNGGTGACNDGCGTVFKLNLKTGAEKVAYSFQGNGTDGMSPESGLIGVKGMLYGTTPDGGTGTCYQGCGTVFSIDPRSGAETVLYSFQDNGADGIGPLDRLIDINGILYGTTYEGGVYGFGTVFSIDAATGAETVLYSFAGSPADGASPQGGLIDVDGTLYGTTYIGGAGNCDAYGLDGCGTVFSIVP